MYPIFLEYSSTVTDDKTMCVLDKAWSRSVTKPTRSVTKPSWMDKESDKALSRSVTKPSWMDKESDKALSRSVTKPSWMDKESDKALSRSVTKPSWMDKKSEKPCQGVCVTLTIGSCISKYPLATLSEMSRINEDRSVPSVGSGTELVGVGHISRDTCPSSERVSFLCLRRILRLSWLGEGRLVELDSMGLVRSRSVCVRGSGREVGREGGERNEGERGEE